MNTNKTYHYLYFAIIGLILILLFTIRYYTLAKLDIDLDLIYSEAKDAYYEGNLELAIEKYQEITEHQPDARATLSLGAIYEELGEYRHAILEYQKFLKYNPVKPEVILDIAIANYNLGKLEAAEKELQKLLGLRNEASVKKEAAYYLSKIYQQHRNYNQAVKFADQALKLDSKFALAIIERGWSNQLIGKIDEAIRDYLKALKIDGSLKGVHQQLGALYLEKGDYDQAYYRFDRAVRENEKDEFSQNRLVWLEQKFPGRFKRSIVEPEPKDFPKYVKFAQVYPLNSNQEIRRVRIGLANGEPQKTVIFRVGADFRVIDDDEKTIAQGKMGEIWQVVQIGDKHELAKYPDGEIIRFSNPIRIQPLTYAPILIHQVLYGKGYYWSGKQDRQYRGELELIPQNDGITMVNIVNLEEYLYSVVASEMPASWPLEALKVQTVAARTYTYYNLGKYEEKGFDLYDSVSSAAYNGINWERKSTRQAVQETLGEIMTYDGKPINAVYSANSGGHTEDVKDVWGIELDYLKAVPTLKSLDQYYFPLEPQDLKNWLRTKPESFSADLRYTNSNHYRWQRRVSRKFIESKLDIGTLKELKVTGRGVGGSVISIVAIGDNGQVEIKNTLRSKLGGLRSNSFFFRPEYENGQLVAYVFYGGGWGHSTGLDQVASAGMAKEGIQYDAILKHFYTDINLEQIN